MPFGVNATNCVNSPLAGSVTLKVEHARVAFAFLIDLGLYSGTGKRKASVAAEKVHISKHQENNEVVCNPTA